MYYKALRNNTLLTNHLTCHIMWYIKKYQVEDEHDTALCAIFSCFFYHSLGYIIKISILNSCLSLSKFGISKDCASCCQILSSLFAHYILQYYHKITILPVVISGPHC